MTAKPVNIDRVRIVAERRIKTVRVYSYQSLAALERLRTQGYLSGDHGCALYDEPYDWMRAQMADRVAGFSGDRPIWAWLRRCDNRRFRAELHEPKVRITALVPTARMVVSNFSSWTIPLNDGFLGATLDEMDAMDRLYPDAADMPTAIKHASWTRVFDLSREGCGGRFWQVCIDRIYAAEVVAVRTYAAVIRP